MPGLRGQAWTRGKEVPAGLRLCTLRREHVFVAEKIHPS